MSDPIDFYFDFSSPYGYFAATRIDEVVAPFERRVVWHPILLGPAFEKSGSRPLTEQPLKKDYVVHDWARLARFMDLPWQLPDPFPVATVRAARAFYCLADEDEGVAKRFALAVFTAYFGDNRDISKAEVVGDVLEAVGADRDAILAAIETDAVKQRLRDEVAAALDRGVFGSPYVIVDGEPFWGADRFWMIRRWLKRGGW